MSLATGTTGTTGFLEESPGVRSMVRLTAAQMVLCLEALVVAVIVVALKGSDNAAGIIAAVGGVIGLLAGGVWAALKVRNTGEASP